MTDIIMTIGKAPEGSWRRDNLLKVKNCMDKGDHYEVTFQYIDHTYEGVKQIRLTYKIMK
jgi:hypothetical protein